MKRSLLLVMLLCCCTGAFATVTDLVYTVSYTCTGTTGPFPFAFPISDPTAMTVTMNGVLQNPANYTIVPVNNNYTNGGSVTLSNSNPCMNGWPMVLTRVTPLTQTSHFYDNMPVPMSLFEKSLDKLTMIDQEIFGETIHNLQFQNNGVNVDGPLTGSGVLDYVGCTVTGSSPTFTINCVPGGISGVPGVVYANAQSGSSADAQINNAITAACANASPSISLSGMTQTSIASTVSLGCTAGKPLYVDFNGSPTLTPGSNIDMFIWLPSARSAGQLSVNVTGVSGYSHKVMQLSGNKYDNQPGNLTSSQGPTVTPAMFINGSGNSTGTCLYLSGTSNTTEYIENVFINPVSCSGMLYGMHAVTASMGWINANTFLYVGCTSSVHCFVADTTNSTGTFNGNTYTIYSEFLSNLATQTLDALWLKGTGEIAGNQGILNTWDWGSPGGCSTYPTCATLRVDGTLAHNFGNVANGQVFLTDVVDSGATVTGYDTISSQYFGNFINTNGIADFIMHNTSVRANGFQLERHAVLTGDVSNNTIIDPITSAGGSYLRSGSGAYKASMKPTGTFVVEGTQTTQDMADINTSTLTTGGGLHVFHNTSSWSGTGIEVDVANGSGSFTGNLFSGLVNTTLKFGVDATGAITTGAITGSTQCVHANSSGVLSGTGSDCGSGGGGGTIPHTTDLLVGDGSGNAAAYAGASSCTNQFMTGFGATGASTCTTNVLAGAQHANQGTTTTVLHGNAAGNPLWSAVNLATDVTSILTNSNGGTGQNSSVWTGLAGVNSGVWQSQTGTQGQSVGYSASGVPLSYTSVHWPGVLFGLVADNSTNNCTNLTNALSIISNSGAGGGVLDPPYGNLTKSNCVVLLPANTYLGGSGPSGSDIDGYASSAPSGWHFGTTGTNVAPIQMLGTTGSPGTITRGGVINSTIVVDDPYVPCILATGMIPNIDNSSCYGSGTNPGIVLGSMYGTCVPGSPNSNFCGYYGWIHNFYLQNGTAAIELLNAANGMEVDGVFTDVTDSSPSDGVLALGYVSGGTLSGTGTCTLSSFNNSCTSTTATATLASGVITNMLVTAHGSACANPPTTATIATGSGATCSGTVTLNSLLGGYAVAFNATSGGQGAYGNQVRNLQIEQTNTMGTILYKGAVGFANGTGGYTSNNFVDFTANDTGTAAHGAYVLSSNSIGNKLQCQSPNAAYTNNQCVSDSGSIPNAIDDTNASATYWRNANIKHIGTQIPTDDIIMDAFTVGSLPSSANIKMAWVNDSATGTCGTGLGSIEAFCRWNGAAWVGLLDGTSPTFNNIVTTGKTHSNGVLFSMLPVSPSAGDEIFCTDCQVTTAATCSTATPGSCVCKGSGTGAFAKYMNYQSNGANWYCQ